MSENTNYKNYTLEKHLKFLSEMDKDYELLYSIWGLNKQNLTQGLNLVSSTYPHFSKHDISHSMTIVNNIQCLLGEERIKRLGATDTFLILMACLTHDIGMILTHKVIEEEWKKNSFKEFLLKLANSSDPIIEESARLLLNFTNTYELNKCYLSFSLCPLYNHKDKNNHLDKLLHRTQSEPCRYRSTIRLFLTDPLCILDSLCQ